MYVCDKNFINFPKSAPIISISITNLMVKVTGRLMHWVPLFGPLGPLGKAYQMTGTVSIWYISSGAMPKNWADDVTLQELCPKTGLMTSSFRIIQQGARTRWDKSIILGYFDEIVGISDVIQGGQASVWGLHSCPWLGQTFMIQSLSNVIRPQAQGVLGLASGWFIEIALLCWFTKS